MSSDDADQTDTDSGLPPVAAGKDGKRKDKAAAAPKPGAPARHLGLRRFVAYSLLAHFGAFMIWGVPAWIEHSAEAARKAEEKKLAEHFRKEEAKTKEHAHQQHIAQTRHDVQAEMRKDFDKLTANLSQAKRDALWKQVTDKTEEQANHLSDALGRADTPEGDLRTLEAELQRAEIAALDQALQADTSPTSLADDFLARVDSDIAPELAKDLHDQIESQVAQKMHDEAKDLIKQQDQQGDAVRDQAMGQLRDAAAKAESAANYAKQAAQQEGQAQAAAKGNDSAGAANDDKQAGTDLKQAEQALNQAGAAMQKAQSQADQLGSDASQATAAAAKAVGDAKDAVGKAEQAQAAAVAQPGNADLAAAAQAASADAQAASAAAQAAAQAAGQSVGKSDRGAVASAAVQSAAAGALHDAVESAADKDFADTTAPRVAAKLEQAFKDEMAAAGSPLDAAAADQLGKEIADHLAKSVPGMAKAGDAESEKMADLGGTTQAGANTGAGQSKSAAGKAGDDQATSSGGANTGAGDAPAGTGKPNPLDAALAKGLAAIAAQAKSGVAAVAANASKDGDLVAKAKGNSAGGIAMGGGDSAAAMGDLRDTVSAMAKSMSSGRMASMGSGASGSAMGGLRQAALARGGHGRPTNLGGSGADSQKAYEDSSGQIAGREVTQGEHWDRAGATGEASQAEDATESSEVPAQMIGPEVGTDTSVLANADPYKPTFKTLAFTTVPYINGDFAINGDLKKWDDIPAVSLKPEGGPDKSAQSMKIAWSPAGLYFLFVIADPDHKITKSEAGNFWVADVAEIWLDAFNTKLNARSRHSGQQFWIWPQGSASNPDFTGGESIILTKNGNYTPVPCKSDKLQRWATVTPAGWTMEAFLPVAQIADADLSPGRIIGFNTYVTTMSTTNWYWSAGKEARTYTQPDTWGDLLLGGSDAKLEIISGKETDGKHLAMIGQALRLRVTDADMNLDPAQQDKVMVTIKDGHGGQQIAVLEETGNATGVFEGAVSTALALDEPIPAVLAVYEGEKVDITYVDQARANGARDATETISVTFASAVLTQDSLASKSP